MKRAFDDRRDFLAGAFAFAGSTVLVGCASDGLSQGGSIEYGYGAGWGSPWYGYDPAWDGPGHIGPPSGSRPPYATTLPSPAPPRPSPRPMPMPAARPMPRGGGGRR